MSYDMSTEFTYVYGDTEVKKTGRIASKTLSSKKVHTLIEITPVHQISGMWKKWVREEELYQIGATEDDNNN